MKRSITSAAMTLVMLALLLGLPPDARAVRYIFVKIADTNSGLDVGPGAPSINSGGTVAFEAGLLPAARRRAIMTGNGGPLTTIADTAAGVFSGFFGDIRINARGTVAFGADLAGGGRGIFVGTGGQLTTIVTTPESVFSDLFGLAVNAGGTVAFHGALDSGVLELSPAKAAYSQRLLIPMASFLFLERLPLMQAEP